MRKSVKLVIGVLVGILMVGYIAYGYILACVKMISSDDVCTLKSKVVSTSNSSRLIKGSRFKARVLEQTIFVSVGDEIIALEEDHIIKRFWPNGSELVIYELNGEYSTKKFDLFYDNSRGGIDFIVVFFGSAFILLNSFALWGERQAATERSNGISNKSNK